MAFQVLEQVDAHYMGASNNQRPYLLSETLEDGAAERKRERERQREFRSQAIYLAMVSSAMRVVKWYRDLSLRAPAKAPPNL